MACCGIFFIAIQGSAFTRRRANRITRPSSPGDGRRAQKDEKQVKWRKLDTVLDWIMPEETTRGWAFSSPLSLAEMKKRPTRQA
jgi:hypothetical protein